MGAINILYMRIDQKLRVAMVLAKSGEGGMATQVETWLRHCNDPTSDTIKIIISKKMHPLAQQFQSQYY